ncbi:hypothetical protein MKX03_028828 [Papaver bracteatum]|nr:hypothetical protein MKX03_028828 [Papaver bracteatum]
MGKGSVEENLNRCYPVAKSLQTDEAIEMDDAAASLVRLQVQADEDMNTRISQQTLDGLVHQAGFSAPTPIQAQSWTIALQSHDIVSIAKIGSGKSLGYLIPGFMHLKRVRNNSQMGPTVLVLSPTRELATQIQDDVVKFGRSLTLQCTCLYGGAPKGPQLREIERGCDIVVAGWLLGYR